MDTSYRINVVTVYREGMELRSECEEEFKTHRHHFGETGNYAKLERGRLTWSKPHIVV